MDNEQLEDNIEQSFDDTEQMTSEPDSVEESQEDDYAEKARLMGWVDKDHFKGDKSKWTDAKTFVEVAETRLPVMKENYARLEEKYKSLEETVKAQRDYQKEMGKIQYERALKELQSKQMEAVKNADTDTYEKIEKEKTELKDVYSPKDLDTKPKTQEPQEVQEWKAANPWYIQNPQLQKAANVIELQILNEEALAQMDDPMATPMSLAERLTEVSNRVREKYGKKRPTPPQQADTNAATRGKKPGKTYLDLPQDAKEACDRYEKAGVITKSEYVKEYFGE